MAFVDDCQYLVPCLLPEKKPVERLRKFSGSAFGFAARQANANFFFFPQGVVHRQYCFAYVPAGFWSHLIAKISAFSHEMIALAMSDAEKVSGWRKSFLRSVLMSNWTASPGGNGVLEEGAQSRLERGKWW